MHLNDTTNRNKNSSKSEKMNKEDEPSILPKRETFLISMKVNGMETIALIDTGVNECLLRKNIASDTWEINPSPKSSARLFDGSDVDVLGYVNMSLTDREGKTLELLPLYVVAELPYPMTLGANWIRMTGPTLKGKIIVEVGDIGPIATLIDSGCTNCMIRRDVLKDSSTLKIKPLTGVTLTLFDGSKMDVLGYVNLRVSYLGKTVELPFYVVAELYDLLVLGSNWIRRSGAILQSDGKGKLEVTFDGKKEKFKANKWFCNPPSVSVVVDGIDRVAVVDTGASNCSIKRDILTDLQKSRETPTSTTTIMSNGATTEALGIVSLNITFQGITTCVENVLIKSKMHDELVLGMDWIDQTRAVIQSDGSEIVVSLPKRKRSNRLIAYLSKTWNSTFGSVGRISSLVSNLM